MQEKGNEQLLVSPVLVLYLIHASQLGLGLLDFERHIADTAGYDGWITVVLTGLLMFIVVFLMYNILGKGDGDIFKIHRQIFGKWLGGVLSLLLGGYFFLLTVSAARSYVEVIQVWMFPELSIWIFSTVLFLLVYFYVAGGFRVLTGIAFISVTMSMVLVLFKYSAFQFGHFSNLTPVFDHSAKGIVSAMLPMTYSYLGPELLLAYYPFIKHPKKSIKWALVGILLTIIVYLVSALAIFVFFSQSQLAHITWPTLNLWKMVQLPIIERFEYAGIAMHFVVIIPNICLPLWAASRSFARVTLIPKKALTIALALAGILGCALLQQAPILEQFNSFVRQIGVYLVFVYIPLLFVNQKVWSGVKKKRASN